MLKLPVNCINCGCICGSYDPGNISGPVEKCYPPEYIEEPPIIDSEGIEFCSVECQNEFHSEDGLTDH